MLERDAIDHVRFCPIQSTLGQGILRAHGAPLDVSTAVLIDEDGVHVESSAILRLFPSMGFPWTVCGWTALCVPACVRDFAYRAFSRNRASIWSSVKRICGWGDSSLSAYRDRVIGLEEPLPASWGFGANVAAAPTVSSTTKSTTKGKGADRLSETKHA